MDIKWVANDIYVDFKIERILGGILSVLSPHWVTYFFKTCFSIDFVETLNDSWLHLSDAWTKLSRLNREVQLKWIQYYDKDHYESCQIQ